MMKYLGFFILILSLNANAHYTHIGDKYSKIKFKEYVNKHKNSKNLKAIYNTVLINSKRSSGVNRGTGFYIGKHAGQHVFVTNWHVMKGKKECKDARVTMIGASIHDKLVLKCNKVLFSFGEKSESDITVFTINSKKIKSSLGRGLEINFNYNPIAGEPLLIAGFGIKSKNTLLGGRRMQSKLKKFKMDISDDSDCVVATPSGKLLYADEAYMRDIFATGCDLASGDSGAALFSKKSGKVIGLIFGSVSSKGSIDSKKFQALVGVEVERFFNEAGSFAMALKRHEENFRDHGIEFSN